MREQRRHQRIRFNILPRAGIGQFGFAGPGELANLSLSGLIMHSLTKPGVDQLDLSDVTEIDGVGLDLCRIAVEQHSVDIVRPSACVRAGMARRIALGC